MRFSEYFRLWAHENYYANGVKIGREGDFYTSVSVGYVFGALLANYFVRLISAKDLSKNATFVEIGANSGAMMADVIQGVFTIAPKLLQDIKFIIIEPHCKLIDIQRHTLAHALECGVNVSWAQDVSELVLDDTFVVANELFDSFCCDLFDEAKLAYVLDEKGLDKKPKIEWRNAPADVVLKAKKLGIAKGELGLGYGEMAEALARAIRGRGRFVSFDYGQWLPLGRFSLRVFCKHKVFDFFELVDSGSLNEFFGRSDITYNVCFSHLATEFKRAGWDMKGFKTQARALVDECDLGGLIELVRQHAKQNVYENVLKQVKFLTSPAYLGEKFKFIEFIKS